MHGGGGREEREREFWRSEHFRENDIKKWKIGHLAFGFEGNSTEDLEDNTRHKYAWDILGINPIDRKQANFLLISTSALTSEFLEFKKGVKV